MREINFRAWDKQKLEMRYDIGSLSFDTEDRLPYSISLPGQRNSRLVNDSWIEDDGSYSPNENKEAEIMQYTGLKDRYGKGAYEGDIIYFGGKPQIIKWSDTIAGFAMWFGVGATTGIPVTFEIIGNIYENADLLPQAIVSTALLSEAEAEKDPNQVDLLDII